jgi:hypothetical protein
MLHRPRQHSTRVIQHKKGSNRWPIPFDIPLTYQHLPLYEVVQAQQVPPIQPPESSQLSEISVDQAIKLYLEAFSQEFSGVHGLTQARNRLIRFSRYLEAADHSMLIIDLTTRHGQDFVDGLVNARNGQPLGHDNRKRYKGALRSWTRFLNCSGLLEEDVFANLAVTE